MMSKLPYGGGTTGAAGPGGLGGRGGRGGWPGPRFGGVRCRDGAETFQDTRILGHVFGHKIAGEGTT